MNKELLEPYISSLKEEERYRHLSLLNEAIARFGDGDYHFVSSPGRSEIGGNHTDHQLGNVLCASLNIDNLAVFKKRDDLKVTFIDRKLGTVSIDLDDLSVRDDEKNTSASLIRGIAYFLKQDHEIAPHGFDALCDPKVLIGSGISSSACFELMIAYIFAYLDGRKEKCYYSSCCAKAENHYFGKPSGELDQYAIENGGFTAIDFGHEGGKKIEQYDFSFDQYGYKLVLVNTKGSHDNLSDEYGKIPAEMKAVARELGADVLRKTSPEEFYAELPRIRKMLGNDRALLRAIHFYEEDRRAAEEKEAVKQKDIRRLLALMKESGRSSFMYLQNIYVDPLHQNLTLALALSEKVLGDEGACRVHGGGFEGTIQAIVPLEKIDEYKRVLGSVFGEDALLFVDIRKNGTCITI